ncbi:hypothetical protein [Cnuella takakiae]|nr:hypothetical protein [Cnuella takakiae]OLY93167.1 hypothetical protein BUE76_15675 [Cnuella takakiae]
MKLLLLGVAALAVTATPPACNRNKQSTCFKARMEDRGMCGNFTISVLEGQLEGTEASWTNEQTGKVYTNVFRPANPCGIPEGIKNGDTFYFTLDTRKVEDCTHCMAFYPAPASRINIRVQEGPCSGK